MIRTLKIEGFRCFEDFRAEQLGRVNLLVGENNCGKTSLLEAIELLVSGGNPRSLYATLDRRGERLFSDGEGARRSSELLITHLFHNHFIEPGKTFSITSSNNGENRSLTAAIEERIADIDDKQQELFDLQEDEEIPPAWLTLDSSQLESSMRFPISQRGGLLVDGLRRMSSKQADSLPSARFITTESLSASEVTLLLDDVLLTPEEEVVVSALRNIEPTISRIATLSAERFHRPFSERASRAGVVIKCEGISQRLPIGSMGDGIWRILGLVLSLVGARDGILLVDEIDTGLHFSVMKDMWKLVYKMATRLRVQVFATTHSRDCLESLAVICEADRTSENEITIHRIESQKKVSVALTELEIIAAAERGIEFR